MKYAINSKGKRSRMKKPLMLLGVAFISFSLAACGGASGGAQNGDEPSASQLQASDGTVPGEDDSITIDEIEWNVGENVVAGNRVLSLSYINNSPFTIMEFGIEFVQREDVTEEQLTAFDEIYADPDLTPDETPEELKIVGLNYHFVAPGEKADPETCSIAGLNLPTMDQYELMEPSIAYIRYAGGDGKIYTEYYDFLNDSYSLEERMTAEAISEWPESNLAQITPELEGTVTELVYDDEEDFGVDVYGLDQDAFKSYVNTCQEAGFNNIEYDGDTWFEAQNEDGYEIDIIYDEYSNSVSVRMNAPES